MALNGQRTDFPPLAPGAFATFHRDFRGDTWDVCTRCGGKCEINKIGSLMPGEAAYIADNLGLPLEDFRDRYLDGIATPFGVVDVLKLKQGCPFLSADFRCTIRDVKVILCDVYPVVFEVENEEVRFLLDTWCPIVRFVPQLGAIFEREAIPALEKIEAPIDWYRAVSLYDSLCVDYGKIFALRSTELGYTVLTLEQIKKCLDDDAPPPDLAPAGPATQSSSASPCAISGREPS